MDDLPDAIRCYRNDGKQWRCKNRKMEGSIYCPQHDAYHKKRTSGTKSRGDIVMKSKRKKHNTLKESSLDGSGTSHEDGTGLQSNTASSTTLLASNADPSLVVRVKSRKRRKREEWAAPNGVNVNWVSKKKSWIEGTKSNRRGRPRKESYSRMDETLCENGIEGTQISKRGGPRKESHTKIDETHCEDEIEGTKIKRRGRPRKESHSKIIETHCEDETSSGLTPDESISEGQTEGYNTDSQESPPSASSPMTGAKGSKRKQMKKAAILNVNGTKRTKHDKVASSYSASMKEVTQKSSGLTDIDHKTKTIKKSKVSTSEIQIATQSLNDKSGASNNAEAKGRTAGKSGVTMATRKFKGKNPDSKMCHQCQRNDKGDVVYCYSCNAKRFCLPCISKWYPLMTHGDIEEACPVCRKNCNCKTCLRMNMPKYKSLDENLEKVSDSEKISALCYMLSYIAPLVKQLHEEQQKEVALEMTRKGTDVDKIESCKLNADERLYWSVCNPIHLLVGSFLGADMCSSSAEGVVDCCNFRLRIGGWFSRFILRVNSDHHDLHLQSMWQ